MIDINVIGGGFQHVMLEEGWNKSKFINWVKDYSAPVYFYMDDAILSLKPNNKTCFGWLFETPEVTTPIANIVLNNLDYFKSYLVCIFTNSQFLLDLDSFFQFVPSGGSWIFEEHNSSKTKLCSVVMSRKAMFPGHLYRLNELKSLPNFVDHYGKGFKEIEDKEEALSEYYFSFAFENIKADTYFTEKIMDCFLTKTFPIYYGTSNICKFFNKDGILFYEEEKANNFSNINSEFYFSKLNAIEDNYNLAKSFRIIEDWIWLNYNYLITEQTRATGGARREVFTQAKILIERSLLSFRRKLDTLKTTLGS